MKKVYPVLTDADILCQHELTIRQECYDLGFRHKEPMAPLRLTLRARDNTYRWAPLRGNTVPAQCKLGNSSTQRDVL